MTVVLPSHLTYGKIVARWIKAIGDTPEDPDKLPEAIAVQGKVIIVPKNKANVTLDNEGFASTYVGVAYERSEYQLNSLGQITDPHGDVGVWLITGAYTIECQFTNGSWPSFDFEVTAEHTDLAPLDLLTVSPTQPIAGVQMVVSVESALRAEAAALEAEAIAATIPEFHIGTIPPEDPDVYWLDTNPINDTLRVLLAESGPVSGAYTFSSIPAWYNRLRVEWYATNSSSGGKTRTLTMNGDTSVSYGINGGTGLTASSIPVFAPQAGAQSAFIEIYRYADSIAFKTVIGHSFGTTNAGNANWAAADIWGVWGNINPITSLTFTPLAGDVCEYVLYGIM